MIRAVIFDCFGVLTFDGWLAFKHQHFGADTDSGREATELGRQVNAGILEYKEFIQKMADMTGEPLDTVHRAIHDNVPNGELFDHIGQILKPKYKLAVLSNAGRGMLEEIFSPEQLNLFDVLELSYETGHIKPERAAYTQVAERLGLTPEECVFIDDVERYCTAARDTGMQAVWYQDFEQMRSELAAILAAGNK